MREEVVRVLGFHCQRCIGSVERTVKALPGVQAVVVHAATKRVIVVYDDARCDRGLIERSIYAEGYDVAESSWLRGGRNFKRWGTLETIDGSRFERGTMTTIC